MRRVGRVRGTRPRLSQAVSKGRRSTEFPINAVGEVLSVIHKEYQSIVRVLHRQEGNVYSVWATELQEPLLVHGYLQAAERPQTLSRKAETPVRSLSRWRKSDCRGWGMAVFSLAEEHQSELNHVQFPYIAYKREL